MSTDPQPPADPSGAAPSAAPSEIPAWALRVRGAIQAQVNGQQLQAVATLNAVLDDHPEIVYHAIIVMIDTFLGNIGFEPGTEAEVYPSFRDIDADPTAPLDVDTLNQDEQWAGRMIAARARDDMDGYNALLDAHNDSGRLGLGLAALLGMIGRGIRAHFDGLPSFSPMVSVDAVPDSPEGLT